mgnify:CR=1 FL=1
MEIMRFRVHQIEGNMVTLAATCATFDLAFRIAKDVLLSQEPHKKVQISQGIRVMRVLSSTDV